MAELFRIAPIVPKSLIDTARLERAVQKALDGAANKGVAQFNKLVSTWDDKPKFIIQRTTWQRVIRTDDRIFQWVDKGVKRHPIPVGSLGYLQFQRAYKPKTSPHVLASFPGGGSGPVIRVNRTIGHPGIKARNFSQDVAEYMKDQLYGDVSQAVLDALNK